MCEYGARTRENTYAEVNLAGLEPVHIDSLHVEYRVAEEKSCANQITRRSYEKERASHLHSLTIHTRDVLVKATQTP